MKNYIMKFSFLCNVLALCALAYCSFGGKKTSTSQIGQIKTVQTKSIAVFVPAVHPALDEIQAGFINEVQKNTPCSIKIYNAQGNKTLLRAQAEEILINNYDLVFTIGALCTKTIQELSSKKQSTVPVVFCSVDDPVLLGVVASLESSGNNLTGVTESTDYKEQIDLLFKLKPMVKKVLVVYDPTHGTGQLVKDAESIRLLLEQRNASMQTLEVFQANELHQKVVAFLNSVDTVLIFKDHTTVTGVDSLIKLCNQHGVTLYVSDLNSGDKGAALAYGILEKDSGIQAAHKALLILDGTTKPYDIAVTPVIGQKIKINSSTAVQQGLTIDEELLVLLRKALVV